jgi:hypothetical protein
MRLLKLITGPVDEHYVYDMVEDTPIDSVDMWISRSGEVRALQNGEWSTTHTQREFK